MDVLLVEDDDFVRTALGDILRHAGYGVTEVPTAEDALDRLPTLDPAACLITDLNLGAGMDGLALGAAARRARPDLPILYITGEQFRLQGHSLGPRERALFKPFRTATLLAALRELGAAPPA